MYNLFHYTSINTLKLILKNRTLRFQSLELMDDPNEQKTSDFGNIGSFHFVSCWTSLEEESIPQWDRYGDNSKGIRLNINFSDIEEVFETTTIMLDDGTNKTIAPFLNPYECPMLPTDGFLPKVKVIEYSKEQSSYIPSVYDKTFETTKINLLANGKIKSKYWEFQQEVRFDIAFLPWSMKQLEQIQNQLGPLFPVLFPLKLKEAKPPMKYFDLAVNPKLFESAKIILGPKTNEADLIELASFLKENNLNIEISRSQIELA